MIQMKIPQHNNMGSLTFSFRVSNDSGALGQEDIYQATETVHSRSLRVIVHTYIFPILMFSNIKAPPSNNSPNPFNTTLLETVLL